MRETNLNSTAVSHTVLVQPEGREARKLTCNCFMLNPPPPAPRARSARLRSCSIRTVDASVVSPPVVELSLVRLDNLLINPGLGTCGQAFH